MSSTTKILFSFIAGAAAGALAATLISKEDREKLSAQLKEKTAAIREKLAAELDDMKTKMNAEKNT